MQVIAACKPRCIAQLPSGAKVAEQGFPGFERTQWRSPPAALSQPAVAALAPPATNELLAAASVTVSGGAPADPARLIVVERRRGKSPVARARILPNRVAARKTPAAWLAVDRTRPPGGVDCIDSSWPQVAARGCCRDRTHGLRIAPDRPLTATTFESAHPASCCHSRPAASRPADRFGAGRGLH